MKLLIKKLGSRKLWAAIIGATIAATGDHFGLSGMVTAQVSAIVVGYILGQGYVDGKVAAK